MVGMQHGSATLEDSLSASYKNYTYSYSMTQPRAPWYLPKGAENLCPHKNLHMNVYTWFIHNCHNLEETQNVFSKQMDK